jgi:hypothetical protein
LGCLRIDEAVGVDEGQNEEVVAVKEGADCDIVGFVTRH